MAENCNNCVDVDIKRYIDEEKNIEDVLHDDGRWKVFYNFAPIREGLLNWYDFDENAVLLELGCEYGALTSLYCRKCRQVIAVDRKEACAEYTRKRNIRFDNLSTVCMDIDDIEKFGFERQFDYIVVMPAYYGGRLCDVLDSVKQYLKKSGSLFIIADNLLGVNTLSGKTYGGEPFAEGSDTGKVSKEVLGALLKKQGYTSIEWFYPMPDYVVPQEIYTDKSIPDSLHTDRIIECYPYKETMIAEPDKYMREAIENKIFPQLANSFLVECKMEGITCGVTYAALSTDRERNSAYATKIYGDKLVTKEPLYDEGQSGLDMLYDNAVKLERRGIPVIKHELSDGKITMPFIKDGTMMQFMLKHSDRQEVIDGLIEDVYRCIIGSSDAADAQTNAMLYYDSDADWGVILSEAYLDMIPFNCFYDGKEMAFFDQEFCVKNYPAKYVVFRMLRYVDLTMKNAGLEFELEKFKVRYGLKKIWNYCLSEEDKFIFKNRNHKMLDHFYGWISLSDEDIHKNILRLQRKAIDESGQQGKADSENTSVEGAVIKFPSMFYAHEEDGCGYWRWCNAGQSELVIENNNDKTIRTEFEFEIVFPNEKERRTIEIYVNDSYWAEIMAPARICIPIEIGGMSDVRIRLRGNLKEYHFDGDARTFFYQIRNYSLRTEPEYVDDTIKKVRSIQIRLLKAVDTVCSKHGLQYFAIYGTLLGTIRNAGYVPWDDDIDIAMPRCDYERFLHIVQTEKEIDPSIFLQNMYTDNDIFFGGYSKLRYSESTGIFKRDYKHRCNQGVWIDIFPLDNRIADSRKWSRQYRRIRYIQKLMYYKVYKKDRQYADDFHLSFFDKTVSKVCRWNTLCDSLDKVLRKYNDSECAEVAISARMISESRMVSMNNRCFEDYELRRFENVGIRIPVLYKECLDKFYGYNYMLYPDDSLRKPHTDVYYNTDAPYREECVRYKNADWEK